MNFQILFLAQKSNTYCLYDYRPRKKEFEDKKGSEVKKISNISIVNQNRGSGGHASQSGQSDQMSDQFGKRVLICKK